MSFLRERNASEKPGGSSGNESNSACLLSFYRFVCVLSLFPCRSCARRYLCSSLQQEHVRADGSLPSRRDVANAARRTVFASESSTVGQVCHFSFHTHNTTAHATIDLLLFEVSFERDLCHFHVFYLIFCASIHEFLSKCIQAPQPAAIQNAIDLLHYIGKSARKS